MNSRPDYLLSAKNRFPAARKTRLQHYETEDDEREGSRRDVKAVKFGYAKKKKRNLIVRNN